MIRDPVCGKRINRNKAHITVEYRGREYHLCCPLCQASFEKDPERYSRVQGSGRRAPRSRE
jgi:YHS domain-containing protein